LGGLHGGRAEIELKFLFAERNSANIEALVSQSALQGSRPINAFAQSISIRLIWTRGSRIYFARARVTGKPHSNVKRMTSSASNDEWEAETSCPARFGPYQKYASRPANR
jgi:hypothetical protein